MNSALKDTNVKYLQSILSEFLIFEFLYSLIDAESKIPLIVPQKLCLENKNFQTLKSGKVGAFPGLKAELKCGFLIFEC